MKLIIAGSRTLSPLVQLIEGITHHLSVPRPLEEVVSGAADGVDAAGERWATYKKTPIKQFPANWTRHGRAAGMIRNKQMAEYADALLIIWDGKSRGSLNMRDNMIKLGKTVYECILREV